MKKVFMIREIKFVYNDGRCYLELKKIIKKTKCFFKQCSLINRFSYA